MSSPVVAGVVALILDANQYLSAAQVKEIIKQTAREDSYTGVIPTAGHTKWGWGKVNAYAAVQLALTTTGTNELNQELSWNVYPNPAHNVLHVNSLTGKIGAIQIIDQLGRIIMTPEKNDQIDISFLNSGVYIFRIVRNGKVEQLRFVKG